MVGKTLGHYEILEPLGAGGMGEVYLAEDTRLGRKVAIKVLPAEFASDPERLARFEQEARAAAALNHPHIAVVHDIGTEGDTHFMVQEYLEGQSLRERLGHAALPLDESLDLAVEIAEAMSAAHAAGIVHRDLKPDNVFVTREGHAKVLDFGLAKLVEAASGSSTDTSVGTFAAEGLHSPTMVGTAAGQVMGTAGYMAPEQVEGRPIDRRADLFAFGCLLYEMVSGQRPFTGRSLHQTLDKIVNEDPRPLEEVSRAVPLQLRWMIDKCLAKSVSGRYQHADDLIVDLRSLRRAVESGTAIAAGAATSDESGNGEVAGFRVPMAWLAAATVVGIALGVAVMWGQRVAPAAARVSRSLVELPPDTALVVRESRPFALSPDGSKIVSVVAADGVPYLSIRRLEAFDAVPIPGTEGASFPFWSPNGDWVGFVVNGTRMMKVSLAGGEPEHIADFPGGVLGATWTADDSADGSIIAGGQGAQGLVRVAADGGGGREQLTRILGTGERHASPQLLPDGNTVLFTKLPLGGSSVSTIATLALDTRDIKDLLPGLSGQYVDSGHIVFAQSGSLLAAPFDIATQFIGDQFAVGEAPAIAYASIALFDAVPSGDLVYVAGSAVEEEYSLVWVDREGNIVSTIPQSSGLPYGPRLSPDGLRLAFGKAQDIFVYNETTGTRQLTFDTLSVYPGWIPDSELLHFMALSPIEVGTANNLFSMRADGGGSPQALFETDQPKAPGGWSGDGSLHVFHTITPETGRDLWMYTVNGDPPAIEILATEFSERAATISPDGSWIAYVSNETGRDQIWVLSYPDREVRRPLTADGGVEPLWSSDGATIYYRSRDHMMAIPVDRDNADPFANPVDLFVGHFAFDQLSVANYDVTADGRRFVMIKSPLGSVTGIRLVLNWLDELAAVPGR